MINNWFCLVVVVIFGACIGSFLNVVIYRLPRGLTLMNPRFSFCPTCKRTLEWWENVPVLAWFYLGARCRTCRNPISPIYPAIEGLTAAVFGLVYWGLYINPLRAVDFGHAGLAVTWPVLAVYLVLIAGMIGATVIDAKYYIIPIRIPWLIAATALVLLPLGVLPLSGRPVASAPTTRLRVRDPGAAALKDSPRSEYLAVAPQAVEEWFGAALGGTIGLGIALVLLRLSVLPQSFAEDEGAHDEMTQHPHAHLPGEGHAPVGGAGPGAGVGPGAEGTVAAQEGGAGGAPNPTPVEGAASQDAGGLEGGAAPGAESTPKPLPAAGDAAPAVSATTESLAPATTGAGPTVAESSPPTVITPAPVAAAVNGPVVPASAAADASAPPITSTPAVPEPSVAALGTAAAGSTEPVATPAEAPTEGIVPVAAASGEAAPAPAPEGDHDALHVPQKAEEIDAWLAHPHLNREIGKEALFLLLPALGAIIGAVIYYALKSPRGGVISPWLQVLAGVLCGYLVGGAVVWIVRILGSLGFQKEAMGLGDVHLLAAIGAAMGAVDSVVIFFAAAFLGLGYAGVVFCLNRVLKERQLRIIPYGPYLAVAAVLLMVFEPWIVPTVMSWFTVRA